MKVLAYYLPQYHQIKENDEWWGEGYTEWTAVKNAKPLFKKHIQPKVPLNNNYYNLCDNNKTWKWQAQLAKKYNVYGFAIYHYWSNGNKLLEKPCENFLKDKSIDINYCFVWANHSWTRTWYSKQDEILWPQSYNKDNDIENHFNYLKDFFLDERYIKIDNKPIFVIYNSVSIPNIKELISCWNKEAIKLGFAGVYIISGLNNTDIDYRKDLFNAYCFAEPGFTVTHNNPVLVRIFNKLRRKIVKNKTKDTYFVNTRYIYSKFNKSFKNMEKVLQIKIYKSCFANWDNTPRRKEKGLVYTHYSPKRFGRVLSHIKKKYFHDEFIFINAWNEWGEGCYLEPDSITKYAFLEKIRKVFGC